MSTSTKVKDLQLNTELITPKSVATTSELGLVKVGDGLVVDSAGSLYLKFMQNGKLFLPTGEMTEESTPRPIFRTLGLVYSTVQETVTAQISEETYVWNGEAYVVYP